MKKKFDRKAIVLGFHLSLAQELGKNGIECILIDKEWSVCKLSRYIKFIECPDPAVEEDKAASFLFELCAKEEISPILFPGSDEWSMTISKHKDKLSKVSIPCIADQDTISLLLDKDRFCRWGQERGFMTPRAWSAEEVQRMDNVVFPILAKPKVHRSSSNGGSSHDQEEMDRLRFVPLRNKEEVEAFLVKEREHLKSLSFQEYVEGMSDRMFMVGLYADRESNILGMFTGHKIRGYPASHGDCTIGERCDLPEELVRNCEMIVKELHFSGFAEFEYKRDVISGEYKLIEINPRGWSWMGIGPACDVNLPMIAYEDLNGTWSGHSSTQFPGTVKYVFVAKDFANCLFRYKWDYPQWSKTFNEWLRDIKADRVVIRELYPGDYLVTVVLFMGLIKNVITLLMKEAVNRPH